MAQQRILQLWKGSLHNGKDAFRLLLHIDYVVDWAREVYRGDVVRALKCRQITAMTVAQPSLPVTNDRRQDVESGADSHEEADKPTSATAARRDRNGETGSDQDALRIFDSPHGAMRDARYIRSRFLGIYVTEDNFTMLMRTAVSAEESKKLASNILSCLKAAWRVRRDALDTLEALWTETDRLGLDTYPPDKAFLAVFTTTAYFAPDWEQTREIAYLAVAETLVDGLLEVAGQHRFPREEGLGAPFLDSDTLIGTLDTHLRNTAEANLLGCSARACWETGITLTPGGGGMAADDAPERIPSDVLRPMCVEKGDGKVVHRLDVAVKRPQIPKARNFIYDLYRRHKIGQNEPSSSLFRISDYLDVLGSPKQLGEQRYITAPFCTWVEADTKFPDDGDPDFVLVTATSDSMDKAFAERQSSFCVFAMNPDAARDAASSPDALLQAAENGWHFTTRRLDRVMSRGEGSRAWNIPMATYLVCGHQEALAANILAYLQHLSAEAQARGKMVPNAEVDTQPGSLKFWRPSPKGKGLNMGLEMANKNAKQTPHILDVLMLAESLPHRKRLRSVTWRMPTHRNMFIRKEDVRRNEDGTFRWVHPKSTAQMAAEPDDDPYPTREAEVAGERSSGRRGKRPAESPAGPSSSPKKARLLPSDAGGESSRVAESSSSGASRAATTTVDHCSRFEPQDWVTDQDLQALLEQGAFGGSKPKHLETPFP